MNSVVFLVVVAASFSLVSSQQLCEVCKDFFGQLMGIHQFVEECKLDCTKQLKEQFLNELNQVDYENMDFDTGVQQTVSMFRTFGSDEAEECCEQQRAVYKEKQDEIMQMIMDLKASEECENRLTEVFEGFVEDLGNAIQKAAEQF